MKNILTISLLCSLSMGAWAQTAGFTVKGRLDMPDGTQVSLTVNRDGESPAEVASAELSGGKFTLIGRIGQPQPATLMTNNMAVVDKNGWPVDSVRWTYTDLFLSDCDITVAPDLSITGGGIQDDYKAYLLSGADGGRDPWEFIKSRPGSVISVFLANGLLKRAYNLRSEQVELLASTIRENPLDTARYGEFLRRTEQARRTAMGMPLLDVSLTDRDGKAVTLADALPEARYRLVDFWASWCGICIHSMPEIREIAEQYKDCLKVTGVSIDEKDDAWRKAMERNPEPWPQYRTTREGYRTVFDGYQIGAGVPYYLLIDAGGNVIKSPSGPAEIRELLKTLTQKDK